MYRYVPYVGDSKRALDEYTSEIFMGGKVSVCYDILYYVVVLKSSAIT